MCALAMIALPAGAGTAGAQPAAAPPIVLRIGTVAPEGSEWAREFAFWVKEIDQRSSGRVKVKLYLGAVAGDDLEMQKRIDKNQLDGQLAAATLCNRLIPSMRVGNLNGMFQNRDEAFHVMHQLYPTFEREARQVGWTLLGIAGIGTDMVFSRRPITSMAELRRTRLWRWDQDEVSILIDDAMGFHHVLRPLYAAGAAYDRGDTDGFFAIGSAALVFQWYSRVKYLLDLRLGYLTSCVVIHNRAFDRLDREQAAVVREATIRLAARFENLGRKLDDKIQNGLFDRAGVKRIKASRQFRGEFFEASRQARDKLGERLVPRPLQDRVMQLLADYRAEHGGN